jgi:ribosomal protein S18 acetylase RimI-like enzyme
VTFRQDAATATEIEQHLQECSADFCPPLESRVDLPTYAAKLRKAATTCEAWHGQDLVGLIAYYRNDATGVAFITSVSTSAQFRRSGLARALLAQVLLDVDRAGYSRTELEVDSNNIAALGLYRSVGFAHVEAAEGAEATKGDGRTVRLARATQPAARRSDDEERMSLVDE